MRRLLIGLGTLPVLAALGALSLHGPIVEAAGAKALSKVQARLGLPVTAERVFVDGAALAGVDQVRIGPAAAPLITARRIFADIDPGTQWSLSPWPERLRIEGAVIHVRGDGTLEGAVRALKDAIPRPDAAREDPKGDGSSRPRPKVEVDGGRLVDHAGGLDIREIKIRFIEGHYRGSARVATPALGPCTFEGDLDRVQVDCAESMTVPLPGGLQVVVSGVELERRPEPRLTLPGVTVVGAGGGLASKLGGLSADLSVGLEADAEGRRPVRARLALPGGGQIVGIGKADRHTVRVRADVSNLSLDPVHQAVSGSLSGNITVSVDLQRRHAIIEGESRLDGLRLVHSALAEGPVGPFRLGLAGRLELSAPSPDPKAIELRLTGGRVTVGDVEATLEGHLDNTGDFLKVKASAAVPEIPGAQLSQAIPPGLLPHLQPIRVAGPFSFSAELDLDMEHLKDLELDADLSVRRLKVIELSDEVGFGRLRKIFYTRFEMPDGEVIVRETGPHSGRWTPLEQVPPLLPLAITAQEDGGFYRHGGVSLLHLRGSLIRNLERGRFARGGSTLTMQLARNLFLNRRKTLSRKLEEVVLTWLLERSFTKDELMTLYVNVVEFGDHIFGIGDASRHYFHKAPRDLTPTEIAFLVRLLPSPRRYGKQFEKGEVDAHYGKRMKRLLKRLVSRGHLSQEAYDAAAPELLWQGAPEDVRLGNPEDVPPADPLPDDPDLEDW